MSGIETSTPRPEEPTWIPGLIVAFGIAALIYVFAYGGNPSTPVLVVFSAIGIGLSLFMLYHFYRFVVAVETIAKKY